MVNVMGAQSLHHAIVTRLCPLRNGSCAGWQGRDLNVTFYDNVRDAVRSIYDKRIDTPAVLDPNYFFPGAPEFCTRWQDIRREAIAIGANLNKVPRFHDLMKEQADISANDGRDWRMFIMRAYGVDVPENLGRCPTVAALLERFPDVKSCAFSFLAPGKHVPKHRGPFRGILRFHLMLTMPRMADGDIGAILEIDGKPYRLADGESLLWDDTFPHEVWNRTDEVRIALLLDIWRRDMPYDIEMLSRLVVAGVRVGMRWSGISYNA
jgi:aspartate beta-hydroxylase